MMGLAVRIYWTFKSIPELSGLSLNERLQRYAHANRSARRRLTWSRRLAEPFAFAGLPAGLGGFVGSFIGHPLLGSVLGGGIGGLVFSQREIARVRRELQAPKTDS